MSLTVGSNKEWKPKPISSNVGQGSGTAGASEVPTSSVEAHAHSQPVSNVLDSEEATSKLQKKLEELHLPQRQHVIIPTHIHVPESERTKLSFGSFDASFGVTLSSVGCQESAKSPTPLSEASQDVDETAEEQNSSNQNALTTAEDGDHSDHPQSPGHSPENLSGDGDISSSIPEYNENKQDNALPSGGHPYSVVHTPPNYNIGLVPPILAPLENPESQAREVSRLSSFVVQQPFDPATYYAQYYRSSADNDGRLSPFPSAGIATKYNGNVAVLPPQTSQPPQEDASKLLTHTYCCVSIQFCWDLELICIYWHLAGWKHFSTDSRKSNSNGNSSCWFDAKFYICDSATSPCLPLSSWGAFTTLSSKLHSICPLLLSFLLSFSCNPPIYKQWCVSSTSSSWNCLSFCTSTTYNRSQIFSSSI
ncbi:hypothetical protein Golax_014344 [Gossypium laxum]|uniref:Uncharacterized protein n=1 Tax=Gossypium laxum TaxID=34288 RepID=A0A7J8ZVX4_9ROSI|nr:hypothetical protein [Gossypium laxum]